MRFIILIAVILFSSISKAQSIRSVLKYAKSHELINDDMGYVSLENEVLSPRQFKRKLRKGKKTMEAYDLLLHNLMLSKNYSVFVHDIECRVLAAMLKNDIALDDRLEFTIDCYLDFITYRKLVKLLYESLPESEAAIQLIKPVLILDYGNTPQKEYLMLLKKYITITGDQTILNEL